jgi:hypothetical protein
MMMMAGMYKGTEVHTKVLKRIGDRYRWRDTQQADSRTECSKPCEPRIALEVLRILMMSRVEYLRYL